MDCPGCGELMKYQPAEKDVGIMTEFYFCPNCDHVILGSEILENDDRL